VVPGERADDATEDAGEEEHRLARDGWFDGLDPEHGWDAEAVA
jgi:hypothetical protein